MQCWPADKLPNMIEYKSGNLFIFFICENIYMSYTKILNTGEDQYVATGLSIILSTKKTIKHTKH